MCHVHPAFDKSSVNPSSAYVINHQHHSINDCHHPPAHTSGAAPHTHARVATGFAGVDKNTAPPARPLQTPQERVPNYTHTHAGNTPYPFASPIPCPANHANPASCRPNGGSGNDMRMGYNELQLAAHTILPVNSLRWRAKRALAQRRYTRSKLDLI